MDNTTNSLAEKSRLRQMIDSYGVPRMIITGFLLLMFVLVPFAGVDFATQISNVINRFSWNAIMALAMVPMVHSSIPPPAAASTSACRSVSSRAFWARRCPSSLASRVR